MTGSYLLHKNLHYNGLMTDLGYSTALLANLRQKNGFFVISSNSIAEDNLRQHFGASAR